MIKTCVPCRTRKVKCDGGFPQCGPCQKCRRLLNCVYELPPKGALWKGEACLRCRHRKKRCDAGRPSCGACKISHIKECVYETSLLGYHGYHEDNLSEVEPAPRHSRAMDGVSRQMPVSLPLRVTSPSMAVTVPASDPSLVPLKILRVNSFPVNPVFSSSKVLLRPTILQNPLLSLTLEDIDEPRAFALSDISSDDLNMKFRLIFLSNRMIYGIYFPIAKHNAIVFGDTSCTVIHPFFIHFAHLVGCQFYQERLWCYSCLHIQAVHLQLTLEALAGMNEEDNPFSLAYACFFMSMAYGYAQNISACKRYLKKSMDILKRNHIWFVPPRDATHQEKDMSSPMLQLLEEASERVALLAQILWVETCLYLIGQPATMGYDFEGKFKHELSAYYSDIYLANVKQEGTSFDLEGLFRYDLPDAYPISFDNCMMMLRVRSIILAKDGHNMIAWYYQERIPSESWLSTCRIFLSFLTSHLDVLRSRIKESMNRQDREYAFSFRSSSIISLTTFAQINYVLAENPSLTASAVAEFRATCSATISRIVETVDELDSNEFRSLTMFLGVYWSRALLLFNPSLNSTTPTTNSSPTLQDLDLKFNISRLEKLNKIFVNNRFLPGTGSLCEKLAAQKKKRPWDLEELVKDPPKIGQSNNWNFDDRTNRSSISSSRSESSRIQRTVAATSAAVLVQHSTSTSSMAQTRSEPSTPSPSTASSILLVAPHPDEPPPPYPSRYWHTRRGRRTNTQRAQIHSQIPSQESDYDMLGGSPVTQPPIVVTGSGGQHAFPNPLGEDHEVNENTPLLASPSSPRSSVRRQGVPALVVNGVNRPRTVSHSSTVYSNLSGSQSLARTLFSALQPDLDSDIDGDVDPPVEERRYLVRRHNLSESSNEQEQDGCAPERRGPTVEPGWEKRWRKYFRPMGRRAYYSATFHLLVLNFPFALAAWIYLFVFTLTGTTLLMALPLGALLCFLDLLGARMFSRVELALQSTFHGPLAYTPYPARPIFHQLRPPTVSEMESGLMSTHDTSFYRNAYAMFTDATSYQALFYFLVIKPGITLMLGITLVVLVPLSFVFVLPAPAMLRIVRRLGIWQANVAVEGLYLAVR